MSLIQTSNFLKTSPLQLNLLKNALTPRLIPITMTKNFGTKITNTKSILQLCINN